MYLKIKDLKILNVTTALKNDIPVGGVHKYKKKLQNIVFCDDLETFIYDTYYYTINCLLICL